MRCPEPLLTTEPIDGGVRVTARYETPETGRMFSSLSTMLFVGIFATTTLAVWIATARIPKLSPEWWLGLVAGGAVCAFAIGSMLADAANRHRGRVRRWTDTTLMVEVRRAEIVHAGIAYARGGVLRFTAIPHREGRREERTERVQERLLPIVYREAFEIFIQHGETFVRLAAVTDEEAAKRIVRRLQETDEQVGRGRGQTEASTFGRRAMPA